MNTYFMAKPIVQISTPIKINMTKLIMVNIKMLKLFMEKLSMVKLELVSLTMSK